VGGAGYAVVGYLGKVVSLESAVIVNTSPKEFMAERLRQICAPLRGLIVSLGVKNVVIEKPVVYGNEISQAAAVKGDLHTLSFSVGAICLCCLEAGVSAENIELINPNQWKGQLSKGQVAERVYPLVDQHRFSLKSHSIDAAGIALWWLGMFV
jgi:Holliday junction resolvasome RuvABC endonuclease subunit